MTQDRTAHWQATYQTRSAREVSWYTPRLDVSLSLLERAGLDADSSIIDVGAGASSLLADLLVRGVRAVTALDISASALELSRQHLGEQAAQIRWRVADVTNTHWDAAEFDFWHDRAALHFLIDAHAAAAYVAAATTALKPGGCAVIGCFASGGPARCSSLEVARRDSEDVAGLFGGGFTLLHSQREVHRTPGGAEQRFAYTVLRKNAEAPQPERKAL